MQLLFEEFFGKISGFIESTNIIFIKTIIKLVFYVLILGSIIFFIFLFYTKKAWIVLVVLGAYILAEIFHYIRKSRESTINKKIEETSKILKKRK